ncbi:hypothetical protein F4859DRAFT_126864 [Xylaria cf. heliscus]|nr:hypothetical protein F4859DRAFT_126864 [Xylaria cf. heliscus]
MQPAHQFFYTMHRLGAFLPPGSEQSACVSTLLSLFGLSSCCSCDSNWIASILQDVANNDLLDVILVVGTLPLVMSFSAADLRSPTQSAHVPVSQLRATILFSARQNKLVEAHGTGVALLLSTTYHNPCSRIAFWRVMIPLSLQSLSISNNQLPPATISSKTPWLGSEDSSTM